MLRKDTANENLNFIKMECMESENKPEFLKAFFRELADMRRSEKC